VSEPGKLYKIIGAPARVVRHEPKVCFKGTPYERENDHYVTLVAHGVVGDHDSGDYLEIRASFRRADAERSFPIGRVIVVKLCQAITEPSTMPCVEMSEEEAKSL
jgi:hypothetical protein